MLGPLCAPQLRQQRLRGDHPNATMRTYGEQVPAIARNENVHLRLNCTSKNYVIGRVVRHRLRWTLRCRDQLGRKLDEKLLDPSPALRLEPQLPDEDPLQLDHHRLGQDELQSSVDYLL